MSNPIHEAGHCVFAYLFAVPISSASTSQVESTEVSDTKVDMLLRRLFVAFGGSAAEMQCCDTSDPESQSDICLNGIYDRGQAQELSTRIAQLEEREDFREQVGQGLYEGIEEFVQTAAHRPDVFRAIQRLASELRTKDTLTGSEIEEILVKLVDRQPFERSFHRFLRDLYDPKLDTVAVRPMLNDGDGVPAS